MATTSVIGIALRVERDDLRLAYLALSARSDMEGLIDDSGVDWFRSGGYYFLHQDAPIYRPDMPTTNIAAVREAPARFASHWITSANLPAPPGYELSDRIGRLTIWRRSHDPPMTETAPGYLPQAPFPIASFDVFLLPQRVHRRW
jgi:hypothetical protein